MELIIALVAFIVGIGAGIWVQLLCTQLRWRRIIARNRVIFFDRKTGKRTEMVP
jgi:hypothetical protein